MMREMELWDLLDYKPSDVDLFCDANGKPEEMPLKGAEIEFIKEKIKLSKEKEFVNERVAIDVEEERGIDEIDFDEDEENIQEMNVEEATLNWRQHMHNIQVSRKLKADAKNKALNSSGTVS